MFASLKLASLVHKLWGIDYEQWLGAREAWLLATIGGATAAGDAAGLGDRSLRIRLRARAFDRRVPRGQVLH
jgi:hypothetical protein